VQSRGKKKQPEGIGRIRYWGGGYGSGEKRGWGPGLTGRRTGKCSSEASVGGLERGEEDPGRRGIGEHRTQCEERNKALPKPESVREKEITSIRGKALRKTKVCTQAHLGKKASISNNW